MREPQPAEPTSLADRLFRLVSDPGRRVPALIVVAYVAAALGLGVAFFGGVRDPNSDFATLGIVFLSVSFLCLFYVSVTVLSLDQGN